jgi:methionine synthase II (cobalamin-independent)
MKMEQEYPWPAASATGIGSMPGTDAAEAVRVIIGELPDFPYLPELPDRGPGADMIGRTAALLVEIPVETSTQGWRLAERPGRDLRRARSLLSADLDALEEAMAGYSGPLKIAVAGPWTLAASIELRGMVAMLADRGAVADLIESLAEGVAAHAADVAKRVPGAKVIIQVDEPALPAVAEGGVPTASGLSRIAVVEADTLRDGLRRVLSATPNYTVVHCCATTVPFGIMTGAGADGLAFDLSLLRRGDEDVLAEAAEAGAGLLVGAWGVPGGHPPGLAEPSDPERVVVSADRTASEPAEIARRVVSFWRRMGIPDARCSRQAVITPACGLTGVSPEQARAALASCREAARILPELIEETGER